MFGYLLVGFACFLVGMVFGPTAWKLVRRLEKDVENV